MDIFDAPPLGFGPGIMPNILKYKGNKEGFFYFTYRVVNKLFISHFSKRRYVHSVSNALRIGYRIIDYSSAYGDGELIGRAIRESGVDRDKLYVTTRISNKAQMKNTVREEFMSFLSKSGLDYVDLLQFHWPVTDKYLDTWREMEKLYEEGYVKQLGVANCHQHHLEKIFSICKYRPEVGQFEIHPLFTQKSLIHFYKRAGITVEAYTSVARFDDRLIRLPLLKDIGTKYNKNVVQVILRWHIQNGVIPIVRSLSYKHQQENFDIFDFELTQEEMSAIDRININSRLRYDPDNCDFSIL